MNSPMDYSDEIFYSPNEILIAKIDCSTIYPTGRAYHYYTFLINRQAKLQTQAFGI